MLQQEVPKIIIVSDAVRGTKVDLDGKKLSGGADGKAFEEEEAVKRL